MTRGVFLFIVHAGVALTATLAVLLIMRGTGWTGPVALAIGAIAFFASGTLDAFASRTYERWFDRR